MGLRAKGIDGASTNQQLRHGARRGTITGQTGGMARSQGEIGLAARRTCLEPEARADVLQILGRALRTGVRQDGGKAGWLNRRPLSQGC